MHMADALISPAVGGVMYAVSGAAMAYSVRKMKREGFDERKIPLMGMMGAFVFAGQMINFTIPATGSSGHIGGGVLLAAMLGPLPALLVTAAVLLIQGLFFADGGLLALGCTIFNLGVVTSFVGYPLYKWLLKEKRDNRQIMLASIGAVIVSLQLGALSVVLQTVASGVTELPVGSFLLLMQPIHLAIGLVEGIITGAVLCFVKQMRPEILESTLEQKKLEPVSLKKLLVTLLVFTVLVGSGLSLFASSYPDGLEWSMEGVAGTAELEREGGVYETAAGVQEATSFMPDYGFKSAGEEGSALGTSTAGIVGSAMTLLLAALTGILLSVLKRKDRTSLTANE